MGVPTSEVGYTSATTGREDHEVHKEHVVALGEKKFRCCSQINVTCLNPTQRSLNSVNMPKFKIMQTDYAGIYSRPAGRDNTKVANVVEFMTCVTVYESVVRGVNYVYQNRL
jgi:hypothetical protein